MGGGRYVNVDITERVMNYAEKTRDAIMGTGIIIKLLN